MLLRLMEEWKTNLDNVFVMGAVLMDLSIVFVCLAHEFFLAKLATHRFDEKSYFIFIHIWKTENIVEKLIT